MTDEDPPSPGIVKRAEVVRKAMKELRRLHDEQKIKGALRMRNGPNTAATIDLPLMAEVLVWRENKGWKGPYKLLAINGETCTLEMPDGPKDFRSTSVKPYLTEELSSDQEELEGGEGEEVTGDDDISESPTAPPQLRQSTRIRRPTTKAVYKGVTDSFTMAAIENAIWDEELLMTFLTHKEKADRELSLKLRADGIIQTPNKSYDTNPYSYRSCETNTFS